MGTSHMGTRHMGIHGDGRDRGTKKLTGKEPAEELKGIKWQPMQSSTTLAVVT